MIPALNAAAIFLIGYIGLHLPRSFLLFYIFAGAVLARARFLAYEKTATAFRYQLRTAVLLLIFAITYAVGMVLWGFWTWPTDSLDIINSLVLPALLFFVGTQAGRLSRAWSTGVLLAYSFGGLVYGLAALARSREPWWNVSQIFPLTIGVAWPSLAEINVRSVEQNAYPALLLIAPALWILARPTSSRQRLLGMLLLALSLLGAHVVWSLNGRLGWLALVLALLPIARFFLVAIQKHLSLTSKRILLLVFSSAVALLAFATYFLRPGSFDGSGVWSQGLCDERISTFASMLTRLHYAPWGGRVLRIPYVLCGDFSPSALLAYPDGSITMVHNVILEIYFTAGWLPVVLLAIALFPSLVLIARGFLSGWACCDWYFLLRWGWFCSLLCQWLFQPLLYSDGLLYYFTFFLIGLFAVRSVPRCSAA